MLVARARVDARAPRASRACNASRARRARVKNAHFLGFLARAAQLYSAASQPPVTCAQARVRFVHRTQHATHVVAVSDRHGLAPHDTARRNGTELRHMEQGAYVTRMSRRTHLVP